MSIKDFFQAIYEGNIEKVDSLLRKDTGLIHARNEQGISPIMAAAYHKQPALVEELIARTVILDIHEAAATGHIMQAIRLLARRPDLVNAYSPDGFQPLGLACFFGHFDSADYFMKAGAEINTPSRNAMQVTPLHSAAAGNHTEIVRLLLTNGADTNIQQKSGDTPLHSAAQHGNLAMTRLLIFHGSDIKLKNNDGKSALELAEGSIHNEVADLLRAEITKRFRSTRRLPTSP